MRPPGFVTRTISFATSLGRGANIAPKMLTTMSKLALVSPLKLDASPSSKVQFASASSCARRLPAATRLRAMSTPRTSAPRCAAGSAVVPSPHPRSSTRIPFVIPRLLTNASPLTRMVAAICVKSPFSQSALFGFTASAADEFDSAAAFASVRLAILLSCVVCTQLHAHRGVISRHVRQRNARGIP